MDLRDLLGHSNRKGRGALRHFKRYVERLVQHRLLTPGAKDTFWALSIEVEYDWATDKVLAYFIDTRTGQLLYSMTDPDDKDQLDALVFAIELVGG